MNTAAAVLSMETLVENVQTGVWKLSRKSAERFGGFFKGVTGTPADAKLLKEFCLVEKLSTYEYVLKTHNRGLLGLVRVPKVTASADFPVAIQGKVRDPHQYKLDRSGAQRFQVHPAVQGCYLKIEITPEGVINWCVSPGRFNEKTLIFLTNPFQKKEATW